MPDPKQKILFNTEGLIKSGGIILFVAAGILSLLFWQERQAFDTAHYLLEIIIRKNFFIAHQRPVGVVSQVLPLAGVWLNVSMVKLMKLYSLGDILYYALIFSWLVFVVKQYAAGLTLLLSYFLTTYYSFYCPVTELLQGIVLLPVLWVVMEKHFKGKIIVTILLLAIIIFSHPLLFIPAGIMIGWAWFQRKEWEGRWKRLPETREARQTSWNRPYFILISAYLIITLFKLTLLDKYDYQKTYYPVVFNDYSNLHNLKDFPYLVSFLRMLLLNYPVSALLTGFTLVIFIARKGYAEAVYFIVSVFGFLLIIAATHRFGGISNYSERMLLPLSFIIALPFSLEIFRLKSGPGKNAILICLVIFLLFRLNEIRKLSVDYTLRLVQMKNLIHSSRALGYQKSIADEEILEQVPTANSGWCYSIESMLFSSLDGPDKTVSIAMQHDHIDRIKAAGIQLEPDEWIKWMEFILKDDTLPVNYFQFKPQLYRPLRSDGKTVFEEITGIQALIEKVGISTAGATIGQVRFEGNFNKPIPGKSVYLHFVYPGGEFNVWPVADINKDGIQSIGLPSGVDPDTLKIEIIPVPDPE